MTTTGLPPHDAVDDIPRTAPRAARHRSDGAPRTPLDDAARHLAGAARRTAVAASASGVVVSMLASPAAAGNVTESGHLPSVDTSALTSATRAALEVSPTVTVPVDVAWSFDVPTLDVVANPEPEPEPVRSTTASRGAAREAAPAAAVPASAHGSAVVEIAARYVGVPYLYGGTTPDGFDCSGFTSYVFAQLGITLPRTSAEQRYAGTEVPADQAQPGDLIWTPGHVSIYAGDGMQIDSPEPGGTVQFRSIYQSNPVFVRIA